MFNQKQIEIMAYKNQKKNKQHNTESRKKSVHYKNERKKQRKMKKIGKSPEWTLEELEEMVKKLG